MSLYLVSRRTKLGMEAAEQAARDEVYGTRNKYHFDENIWNRVSKVTSDVFEQPELIRAWFLKNRENFLDTPTWDEWLNGEDSQESTINQSGQFEFFFMPCDVFQLIDNQQRAKLGLLPKSSKSCLV